MELVAGVDLGTSYFKVGLFDREGTMHGLGRVAVAKDIGNGSLCELPVERFWSILRQALQQTCAQANTRPEDIIAISYSSQAASFLLLDKNNSPLTPLILWPDTRDAQLDPAAVNLWKHPKFLATTGLGIDLTPEFCVSKLKWFQNNQPHIWAQTHRVMTISDYFTFSLTGKFVGDAGTASLLEIYDLPNHRWWADAFAILGIAPSYFSTPLLPGIAAGVVTSEGTNLLGLRTGIPFAVGSLDHHMAAIGAGVPSIAPASESTGTVVACFNYLTTFSPKPNCCMGPGLDNNTFYQLAVSSNGASVLEWYQKNFAQDTSIVELLSLAQRIPAGAEGLTALPSANTFPVLTGFQNASPKHTRGHYVRAILESNAATLKELMEQLCGKDIPLRIVATGGGAKSDLWLQIKANMLGTEILATNCEEPACRGAAMFAADIVGWHPASLSPHPWISISRTYRPIQ
jgi:sugar (pentulose or hexulose) kinase